MVINRWGFMRGIVDTLRQFLTRLSRSKWGMLGVVVLYAMWIAHLLLFRGEGLANWIGLLVAEYRQFAVESDLFDLHDGCTCWAWAAA